MGDDKMTPVREDRVFTEPEGFDHPATERIPAQGDIRDGQTAVDEPVDRSAESSTEAGPIEPETDLAGPDSEIVELPPESDDVSDEPATPAGFFDGGAVTRFQERWRELQSGFVDDPARAVQDADDLVDEVIRDLTERKQELEHWRGGQDDTEELRVAMREYRSFFNQLLNS